MSFGHGELLPRKTSYIPYSRRIKIFYLSCLSTSPLDSAPQPRSIFPALQSSETMMLSGSVEVPSPGGMSGLGGLSGLSAAAHNVVRSSSISGTMYSAEKSPGGGGPDSTSLAGNKKRRSSLGAKMVAIVGLSQWSKSTQQLNQQGQFTVLNYSVGCTLSFFYFVTFEPPSNTLHPKVVSLLSFYCHHFSFRSVWLFTPLHPRPTFLIIPRLPFFFFFLPPLFLSPFVFCPPQLQFCLLAEVWGQQSLV